MLVASKAIVLSKVPYNDRYAVANLYLREQGIVAYRLPLQGGKKSLATRLRRLIYPLSELDIVAEHKPLRSIQTLIEVVPNPIRLDISLNPTKRELSFFLAETLHKMLRNAKGDSAIYDYISRSLDFLEQASSKIDNFPIAFFLHLLSPCGVSPDWEEIMLNYQQGDYFNLVDVRFQNSLPRGEFLTKKEAQFLKTFVRISYNNMHLFHFSEEERRRSIHLLLSCYRIHFGYFGEVHSSEVLESL